MEINKFFNDKYLLMYYILDTKTFDLYSTKEEAYERRNEVSNASGYRFINLIHILDSKELS